MDCPSDSPLVTPTSLSPSLHCSSSLRCFNSSCSWLFKSWSSLCLSLSTSSSYLSIVLIRSHIQGLTESESSQLPVVIWSVNPHISGKEPIITQAQVWQAIVNQLEIECVAPHQIHATTPTNLAIATQQYTQKAIIPSEYWAYTKVFSEEESKWYPPKQAWDHTIEFKKGAPNAVDCKVYPLNQTEIEVVQKFLKDKVEKGYIWPSKSPYASPFFFIKKKDRKLQLV